MQFVGDAVMACFGAPVPLDDHADRAVCAARAMLERQVDLNERWLAAIRAVSVYRSRHSIIRCAIGRARGAIWCCSN